MEVGGKKGQRAEGGGRKVRGWRLEAKKGREQRAEDERLEVGGWRRGA